MSRRRCQKGKSCGGTCIFKGLICRIDIGFSLSSALGDVKGELVRSPQITKSVGNKPLSNRAIAESLALEVRKKRLKKEDYSNEWDKLTSFIGTLKGDEKREASIKAQLAIGKRLKVDVKHKAESEDGARSAGKRFLEGFKTLNKTIDLINRYEALFNSIASGLGPNTTPEQTKQIANKLSEINKRRAKAESDLEKIMVDMREKLMKTNLSDEKVNDLLSRVWTEQASEATRNNTKEFIRMFNGRGFTDVPGVDGVKAVSSIADSGDRAYAKIPKGVIKTNPEKETTFHELAHIIEGQRPWMAQYAVNWRDERAFEMAEIRQVVGKNTVPQFWYRSSENVSIPLIKLKDMFPGSNYEAQELAIVDKFLSKYMGKVYYNPLAPAAAYQRTTEVWSKSFEYFTNPQAMATLYKAHPEIFEVIVGMAVSP